LNQLTEKPLTDQGSNSHEFFRQVMVPVEMPAKRTDFSLVCCHQYISEEINQCYMKKLSSFDNWRLLAPKLSILLLKTKNNLYLIKKKTEIQLFYILFY